MAWTEKYVSSQATGGGDGSSASPWTIAEGFTNLAAGMILYVIADGTYSPTSTLTPGTAIASNDPPAMILGCKSDLSIVRDFADLPVIDFAGLASGNGIDLNVNTSYGAILYGLKVKNAPSDNIFLYRYSNAILCQSENAGYANFRCANYCGAIFCKSVNAATYGYYLPGYSDAILCSYEGSDPPAATAFNVSGAMVGCVTVNGNTGFVQGWHGNRIVLNTAVSTSSTRAAVGISNAKGATGIFGNIVHGYDTGIANYAAALSMFNYLYDVVTPVNEQDASGEGLKQVGDDTTTNPEFNDAASSDYRPTNSAMQAVFDILKQNPGAFPFLPKGGWRPRPRLHGV